MPPNLKLVNCRLLAGQMKIYKGTLMAAKPGTIAQALTNQACVTATDKDAYVFGIDGVNAILYLQYQADQGDVNAAFEFGLSRVQKYIHSTHYLSETIYDLGLHYLKGAAALGHSTAKTTLDGLFLQGEPVTQEAIAALLKENPQALFQYKNLPFLAKFDLIVTPLQSDAFYRIDPIEKATSTSNNDVCPEYESSGLGWKLHVSVNPNQLELAFDKIAHIINRYGVTFKVTNSQKTLDERLTEGTQFTIVLEKNGKPVLAQDNVEKMIGEISQALASASISPGKMPDSDAPTVSNYISMRNDKWVGLLGEVVYVPAEKIGNNFNIGNHANPFSHLLKQQSVPFDPYEFVLSLESNQEEMLANTKECPVLALHNLIRMHTLFDTLDSQAQRKLLVACCMGSDNDINSFVRDIDKNNPEVLLTLRFASALCVAAEADSANYTSDDHYDTYLAHTKPSEHYTYDNSFHRLLILMESRSTATVKGNYTKLPSSSPLLSECLKSIWRAKDAKPSNVLHKKEWVTKIKSGDFFTAQNALNMSTYRYFDEEDGFEQFLLENDTISAVQAHLTKIYSLTHPEKALEYLLKLLATPESNYMPPEELDSYGDLLLESTNETQLKELVNSGSHFVAYCLAHVHARDLVKSERPWRDKWEHVPVNHALAKQYLDSIPLHSEFNRFRNELRSMLSVSS